MSAETHTFARAIIAWHAGAGRHDLPWQQDRTPYRVWVSEIMLQQTQVVDRASRTTSASCSAFRTCARSRTRRSMKCCTSGPGSATTHARATCIAPRCACVTSSAGEFPQTFEDVAGLPGIGRSTAGAILALSTRRALADSRRQREARAGALLRRARAIRRAREQEQLWALSEAMHAGRATSTCTRRRSWIWVPPCACAASRCASCVRSPHSCIARSTGRQHELPAPRQCGAPERHVVHARGDARRRRRSSRAAAGQRHLGRAVVSAGVSIRETAARAFADQRCSGRAVEPEPLADRARVHALRSRHHAAADALRRRRGRHGWAPEALV